MRLTLAAVLAALCASPAAHGLPAQTCPPATKAWMQSGEEMAAACSFEPLFKESIAEIGTEHSCHYDFGKLPGLAGLDVTQDSQKSADAAAKEAVATYAQLPGYSGTAKNLPWAGVEASQFVVAKGGSRITSGYYVMTKKGLLKIEFWTSDRTKTDSCAEKIIRIVIRRTGP
jgi:hypothetical protein